MKKYFLYLAMFIAVATLTTSCSKDEINQSNVTVNYTLPEGIEDVVINELTATLTNVSTGTPTVIDLTQTAPAIVVTEGLYDIDLEGKITYKDGMEIVTSVIRSSEKGVSVTGSSFSIDMDIYISKITSGFVLSELFMAGTQKPDGDRYQDDAYFRITNNSDVTLYADGLFIAESEFQSDMEEYDTAKPDIRKEATAIGYLCVLPGNGTDYPVEPGQSILVAVNGINHKVDSLNPNSFDLSKADFEVYNESTRPDLIVDVDNPDIPNTKDIFTQSATIWTPHVRGVKSYMLGRLGTTTEDWLANYTYHYEYLFVFGEYSFDMDGDAMKIDNSWILDAVNIAPKDQYTWHVIDQTLDTGYAWYSEVQFDESRLGKSVRRKFDSATGKLVDTNNSTNDFESSAEANPFYVFK